MGKYTRPWKASWQGREFGVDWAKKAEREQGRGFRKGEDRRCEMGGGRQRWAREAQGKDSMNNGPGGGKGRGRTGGLVWGGLR